MNFSFEKLFECQHLEQIADLLHGHLRPEGNPSLVGHKLDSLLLLGTELLHSLPRGHRDVRHLLIKEKISQKITKESSPSHSASPSSSSLSCSELFEPGRESGDQGFAR